MNQWDAQQFGDSVTQVTAVDAADAAARRAQFAHARHELRTPLNAIIGFSDLLLEELDEAGEPGLESYVEDIRRIHAAGIEILGRVNAILDPAASDRLTAGDMEACRLRVRQELREPLTAAQGYCDLVLEMAEEEGRTSISAELGKVRSGCRRLLDTLETVLVSSASSVPADRLPAVPEPPPERISANRTTAISASVLVADDNEMNRELLGRRLERQGHQVWSAEDGHHALALLRIHSFDVVLLDVMMPGLDGYDTLRAIKADPGLRHIPVIMISALDEMDSVVRCIELGAEDYLPKTFDPVLLRARLGACLEKKALRDREIHYLQQIEAEKARADALLKVLLPDEIIEELQRTNKVKPRLYQDVAVMFCDVVGFTPYCAGRDPEEVISGLQELIERFEELALQHGVQKIKTVGDSFMGTAGLLTAVPDAVLRCASCGLEMVREAGRLGPGWEVRVGIHCGPVVAGVVGRRQYLFDLWGDTVNTAARVEGHGANGAVNLSAEAWMSIAATCQGASLGRVAVKGKGAMEIFRLHSVDPPP